MKRSLFYVGFSLLAFAAMGRNTLAQAPFVRERDRQPRTSGRDYTARDIAPVLRVRLNNQALGAAKPWSGLWRREGRTDFYRAIPDNDKDNEFRVQIVSVRGNRVEFESVGGRKQRYVGTISQDSERISGTFSDEMSGKRDMTWSASLPSRDDDVTIGGGLPAHRGVPSELKVTLDNRALGYSKAWTGTWRRQNDTNLYRAIPDNSRDNEFEVELVSMRGKSVEFMSRSRVQQTYMGEISADGSRILGTFTDEESGKRGVTWSATIMDNGGGRPLRPRPQDELDAAMLDIGATLKVRLDTRSLGAARAWTGTWKRVGRSAVFKAEPDNSKDNAYDLELTSVRGNRVEFVSRGARRQVYTGTLSGSRIAGTFSDEAENKRGMEWSAEIIERVGNAPNPRGFLERMLSPKFRVSLSGRLFSGTSSWEGVWTRAGFSGLYKAEPDATRAEHFDLDLVYVRGRQVEFVTRGTHPLRLAGTLGDRDDTASGTVYDADTGKSVGSWRATRENP